jgi:hypothetical protein
MPDGMDPNFSLNLLWTTKTANFVGVLGRSDSGSCASSRSTSFCNSEIAYLRSDIRADFCFYYCSRTGVFYGSDRAHPVQELSGHLQELLGTHDDQDSFAQQSFGRRSEDLLAIIIRSCKADLQPLDPNDLGSQHLCSSSGKRFI